MDEPLDTSTDTELEQRLTAERPVPPPGFRAELRTSLRTGNPGDAPSPKLRAVVGAYAVSGLLLLTVAIAGLVGVGPFAA